MLRVTVEELIASGELTDSSTLLASIEELSASIEVLRGSDEFSQVQATIEELRASGDLPEDFPDGGFLSGRGLGRRLGDDLPDEITGERFPGRFPGRFPDGDRFGGGIIGELVGDGESLANSEPLRDRIQELIASGDFDGLRGGIGRLGGRDRIFGGGMGGGIGGDPVADGIEDVDLGGLLPDPNPVIDRGAVV